MATKKQYTVNVGNIGNIPCTDKKEALKTFDAYVEQSKSNYGRAAGESVMLFEDDVIIKDFVGSIDNEAWAEYENGNRSPFEDFEDEIYNKGEY